MLLILRDAAKTPLLRMRGAEVSVILRCEPFSASLEG
jgi:hypothetical protein